MERIVPNRSLGQHFLRDRSVLAREVELVGPGADDAVLEVGAGDGRLTAALCATGATVTAVEIDERFRPALEELAARFPKLRVVFGDGTRIRVAGHTAVCANLPYKVALPLLFRFLEGGIGRGVVLVQERLARRAAAEPGAVGYGRVSVQLQRLADLSVAATVPASAFSPPPEVESALLRWRLRDDPFPVPARFGDLLDVLFLHQERSAEEALARGAGASPQILAGLPQKLRRRQVKALAPEELGTLARLLDREGLELRAPTRTEKRRRQAPPRRR